VYHNYSQIVLENSFLSFQEMEEGSGQMKRLIKMFFALITIVLFITPAHAGLTSTFDTGFEGWTVWDATPDDVTNFRWESAGGNPGGFIAADDVGLRDTFRFRSPLSWGGDWSQYLGGTIEWDIFLYPNPPFTYYNAVELIIDTVGTGDYLVADFDIIPVVGQWTHFKIDLTPENLTVLGSLSFDEIIQNVESIFIRGEFSETSTPDAEGLDNVRVSGPVGHIDYCLDSGPCAEGQGNCDNDAECEDGLICAQDVGADYGWLADIDVCEQPPGADDSGGGGGGGGGGGCFISAVNQ
jgi:hypothetical protein